MPRNMQRHKPPPLDPTLHTEPSVGPSSDPSTMIFNWQDWVSYLGEMGGSDAQNRELIETLMVIVMAFADLGWEIKSEPQPSGKNIDLRTALQAAVVQSEDHQQKEEV